MWVPSLLSPSFRRYCMSCVACSQIMELFEMPPDGVVSRKLFIDRMVDVFVQRRSLQLTLGDYEVGHTDGQRHLHCQ